MPPTPPSQRMGELHEEHVAAELGGKKTKASGSKWAEQGDGRHGHDEPFAFRWDGKSTKSQQIAITLAMIEKIRDQAHGERPAIPLRWYGNEALTKVLEDWIAVPLGDFAEMRTAAVMVTEIEAALGGIDPEKIREALARAHNSTETIRRITEDLSNATDALNNASLVLAERDEEIAALRHLLARENAPAPADDSPAVPGFVPRLPWFVVNSAGEGNARKFTAVRYDKDGHMYPVKVTTVRVERSLGSANRPRLIVNDARVSSGDLLAEGILTVRVCADNPSLEVG